MTATYRATGIFIIVLASLVAAFSIEGAGRASAEDGGYVVLQIRDGVVDDLVGAGDDGTAWFPVPDAFIRAICVDLADVFECKVCTWDPECPASARLDLDSLKAEVSPVSAGFYLPLPLALKLCKTFPDQFECICVGVSPDLCADNRDATRLTNR